MSLSKEEAVCHLRRSSLRVRLSRFTILIPAFLCAAALVAEKPANTGGPKYDVQTETKLKGTVEDVKLPPKGSEKLAVHLLLKSGNDSIDVYLCPQSFLDDMGVTFTKEEDLAITGSKVKDGEADLLLAREVVKGNDTIVLRDAKGKPVWN
jgi:hypothetical protein